MNRFTLTILIACWAVTSLSQVGINQTGSSPDNSAGLDVDFSDKGFLPPRMSTLERSSISNPATGLTIFNTDNKCLEFYVDGNWHPVGCACTNAPVAPIEGNSASTVSEITFEWHADQVANGSKVNLINDYNSATNTGSSNTYTLTGLTCGTTYNLYVWSYNTCGNSSLSVLTGSTLTCPFVCGTNTVSHGYVSGTSPNSTAQFSSRTYSTAVANWSGGNNKCWTKMNLGATAEAASAMDTNADRAGWYFQFNRSQAYYNSGGLGNTPAWSISGINENFAWISANDPCKQLLGGTWRIPTQAEWASYYSAVMTGCEPNCNNVAYASSLKLHTAGALEQADGNLTGRDGTNGGSAGGFYSGEQDNTIMAFRAYYRWDYASVNNLPKAYGLSLRCIMD